MTNTVAAEKTVGEKEKVEKRRALGRGLESLLPGPRVVSGAPGQSGGAAGKQQVPHFVRNDKPVLDDASLRNDGGDAGARAGVPASQVPAPALGVPVAGTIRAVVDDSVEEATRAGAPAPHATSAGSDETITIYAQAESRMPGNLVV